MNQDKETSNKKILPTEKNASAKHVESYFKNDKKRKDTKKRRQESIVRHRKEPRYLFNPYQKKTDIFFLFEY